MKTARIGLVLLCLLLSGCMSATAVAASQPVSTETPAPRPTAPPVAYAVYEDVNPYTGLARDEDYPAGVRGVAVMIDNVKQALPQSGINSADLVYEMETESGITRTMAVWRNAAAMPTVGPVRSARDQHVQLMLPLGCLFAHIGTSTYALQMLEAFRYDGVFSIDGKYRTFYWQDEERRKAQGSEHSIYTDGATFLAAAEKYGMQLTCTEEPAPVFNWTRYEEAPRTLTGGRADTLYVRFSGYVGADFAYDAESGRYTKKEFGLPQNDANDGAPYSADNLLILFAEMKKYSDNLLTKVNFAQQGTGLYLNGGRFETVRWCKGAGEQPLRILDSEGRETDIQINPGRSYIAVVNAEELDNVRLNGENLEAALAAASQE